MSNPINWIKLSSRRADQTTENNLQEMAACLFSRNVRFKKQGRDKKTIKAAFTVALMKFLLNFPTQKITQERIIVESFLLSARLQVRQPSLLHDTVHAVICLICVIHEKVYDKIQREVSKKKLDSLTGAAAAHESQRPKLT